MTSLPVNIAVFASGTGSNLRAIHDALAAMADPPARVALVVSNNPRPGAFDFARDHGIEYLRLSPKMFDDERDYAARLLDTLREHHVGLIVLAGYMRLLPASTVDAYRGRILNIHPALLPDFGGQGMYGVRVHQAVLDAGRTVSGATVHLVDEQYDTGPILDQERIDVLPDDTPESLAARVLEVEHRLYPRVVIEMARRMRDEASADAP